ncbi:MAG: hypothetical protein WAV66_18300, partial [Anaerolineae bacterium]
LDIDSADVVQIGYYDSNNGDLKVARGKVGFPWNIQVVDSAGDVGGYVSLAVDMLGNPHLAYYDWTQYTLKYAHLAGTSWVVTTVADTGLVGFAALALDSRNAPLVAYYDDNAHNLKVGQLRGGSWDINILDGAGEVGRYVALALDQSNTAYAAYYDTTNGDLKVAQGTPATTLSVYIPTVMRRH